MASKVLSGVFVYRLDSGSVLTPVLVTRPVDGSSVVAEYATDRKRNAVVPGVVVEDIDFAAREYITFARVARAARKAHVPVNLGAAIVLRSGAFATQVATAAVHAMTLPEAIHASWREERHDAQKAGFTLDELEQAVRTSYAQ